MKKLVYGVGINDGGYVIQSTLNGKRVSCPYYQRWVGVLQRCYSVSHHAKNPTYIGCEVAEKWKTFSNFKAWMESQDWKGKQLDKDILIPNNKLYSEDTCVFVTGAVNSFLTHCKVCKGKYLIGVTWDKRDKRFIVKCSDGNGNNVHLGYFDNELEAHLIWKDYKHKLACKLAEDQSDPRVAEALRNRFAPKSAS